MQRDDVRKLMLAGTVTFPATYPRVGELRLCRFEDETGVFGTGPVTMLSVTEHPQPKTTIVRRLPVAQVRALFLPNAPHNVCLDDGHWFLGQEIEQGLRLQLANRGRVWGIAYIAEATGTLLEVSAGMTAAESAEYYPPLPCDRSHNHYNPHGATTSGGTSGATYQGSGSGHTSLSSDPTTRLSCNFQEPPTQRFSCNLHDPATPVQRLSCNYHETPVGGCGASVETRLSCNLTDSSTAGKQPFRGERGSA